MPDQINLDDLVPYVAPVLLEASGDQIGHELLAAVMQVVAEQAGRSTDSTFRKLERTTAIDEDGELVSQAVIYGETTKPSWLSGEGLQEQRHQLIVVVVKNGLAALCSSDGAMRDRILSRLTVARPMPRHAIRAFVGGEAKALWLNGIHTPTSSKPDTKTLTGSALEDALDPIGDQSYYYSAARTIPKIAAFRKNERDALVGAAPAGGRIWIRRSENWANFKALISDILTIVANPPLAVDPFALLAQPIDIIDDVAEAYSLAIVPHELLSDDDVPNQVREKARRWAYDARFDVTPLAGPSFAVRVALDGNWIGNLELAVTLDEGKAAVDLQWVNNAAGKASERNECEQALTDLERLKVFYDSGHSLAQGRFYEGGYVDQQFDWTFRSFVGYSIGDEKPKVPAGSTLAAEIAQNGDNSLFAYVVEKLFVDDGAATGWLASDDGSMEAADFIHLDNACSVLSLVHVKAASNPNQNRQAAPADYEVVVGQAVKNLRHLERRTLADELDKGKLKQIGAAVWHNGVKQPNRDAFLVAARKLKARAKKQLIVIQPRISKTERDYCWSDNAAEQRAKRIKQVETLMLAARASAQACGAVFIGIAADD